MPDTPTNATTRHWLIAAARDHVQVGVAGGFCQANHGKARNLKRMRKGDGVVFYSPKERFGEPKPLQAFTTLGYVSGDDVYQSPMAPDFEPFRRNIQFEERKRQFIRSLPNWILFATKRIGVSPSGSVFWKFRSRILTGLLTG